MATVQMSLEEYLRASYHPDCDYVDGEVQERNWGEFDHALTQGFVSSWFYQHRQEGSCMLCSNCGFAYPQLGCELLISA
jgi:hypothetical protein